MPVIATPLPQRLHNTDRIELNRNSWQAAGLVGWFPLGANTEGKDQSLFGHHGSVTAGGTATRLATVTEGQRRGMLFNGTTNYIDLGTHPPFTPNGAVDLSVTCWARKTDNDSSYVLSHSGNSGAYGFDIAYNNVFSTTHNISWSIASNSTSATSVSSGNFNRDTIGWTFIAGTYCASTTTMFLFVRGTDFQAEFNSTAAPSSQYNSNSYGNLKVGGRGQYSSSFGFPGLIDDMRIYNRSLSPNEVYSIWNQTKNGGYGDLAKQPTRFHYLPVAAAVVGEASKSMMLLGVE